MEYYNFWGSQMSFSEKVEDQKKKKKKNMQGL